RFVYGTWYGAMVVFVAVAALLFGLQLANSGFHDIIAWPKGIHIILKLHNFQIASLKAVEL
ncbi:MAG: hypothetical protein IKQ17_04245, partial [Kiritimatiellae bacterium]|nr:hypothetical protein [Kiritimatiellia bacterium]